MSLIFMDSFDYANNEAALLRKWDESSNSNISAGAGRRGTNCTNVATFLGKNLPANPTYFFGFAYNNFFNAASTVLQLREGIISHIILNIDAAGGLNMTRGGTIIGTTAPSGTIRARTFYYIEVSGTINDATGAFTVRVNEVAVMSGSGIDTRNGGGVGTIDNFRLGAGNARYDDLYVLDNTGGAPRNTFLGDIQVDAILPDGEGGLTQFDTVFPGAPTTHFDKVDEINPDLETTYIETPTAADRDAFTMANLAAILGGDTVFGIQVSSTARKTTSGAQNLQNFIRLAATNFDGASVSLTENYKEYLDIYNTDPNAVAEWTTAIIDGIESGVHAV